MERRGFLAALTAAVVGVGAWLAAPWKSDAAPAADRENYTEYGDYAIYDYLHKGRRSEWYGEGLRYLREVDFEEMRSVLMHKETGTALGFDKQLDAQEKAFVLEHCTPPAVLTSALRDWKEWEAETRYTA